MGTRRGPTPHHPGSGSLSGSLPKAPGPGPSGQGPRCLLRGPGSCGSRTTARRAAQVAVGRSMVIVAARPKSASLLQAQGRLTEAETERSWNAGWAELEDPPDNHQGYGHHSAAAIIANDVPPLLRSAAPDFVMENPPVFNPTLRSSHRGPSQGGLGRPEP